MCYSTKPCLAILLFLSLPFQSCTVKLGYDIPTTVLPTKNPISLLRRADKNQSPFPKVSLQEQHNCVALLNRPESKVAFHTFTASSGETVTFFKDQGIWQAKVEGWWQGTPSSTSSSSPMLRIVARNSATELTTILHILAKQPAKVHKHRIHIVQAAHSKCIFLGSLGLLGGTTPEEKESKEDPSSTSPLHKAASQGNFQAIKQLLESGYNPNQVHAGTTPLYWAAKNQHVTTAKLLLEYNAEPNAGDKYGYTPLYFAAESGQLDLVELLLEKHANPNKVDVLGYSPLYWGSQKGYSEIVARLLQKGASPNISNQFGYTPLHQAIENGHFKVVELLLQYGADPNTKDQDGNTPLYIAVEQGDASLVALLLANDTIQPNQSARLGYTPLCCAAAHGYLTVVQLLLSNGADLNQADNWGNTPLHQAAMNGHITTIHKLLQAKANITLSNNSGDTFLHILATQKPALLLQVITTMKGINRVFLGTVQEIMQYACPELLDEAKDILAISIAYNEAIDWSLRNNQGKTVEDLLEETSNQQQAKNILQQIIQYKKPNGSI